MTRKRFKKLLMSGGIPRNVADKYLRINEITMPSVKAVTGVGTVTPEMREKAETAVLIINEMIADCFLSRLP